MDSIWYQTGDMKTIKFKTKVLDIKNMGAEMKRVFSVLILRGNS